MKRPSYNIHERFLRHIWSKQYLRAELETLNKQSLRVIQIGQSNPDGGPDFRNAKIKVAGITYVGDVEIHRTIFDWINHQHLKDPRYNKVVLHVVLEASSSALPTITQSGRKIPVLVLGNFLSESIQTIWQKAILDERARKEATIACFKKNHTVPVDLIHRWLSRLAVERMELKLRRFEERLKLLAHERRMTVKERQRMYGEPPFEGNPEEIPPPLPDLTQQDLSKRDLWEQILYEGIMEGLGYSKNCESFLKLACTLPLLRIKDQGSEKGNIEAVLFGVAGLIPPIKQVPEKESRIFVRELSRRWKLLRPSIRTERLHPADWQFFPTRPSNFPTIRLAAASDLVYKLLHEDFFRRIIQTVKSGHSVIEKEKEFLKLFYVETNNFWKRHYSFDEASPRTTSALGIQRIREILVNVILPITLLYARIFKDKSVREESLCIYQSMNAFEDNTIVRMMERQLLAGRIIVEKLPTQQALIQLYKMYCTEQQCSACEINASILSKSPDMI